MQYLPQTIWREVDRERAGAMIQAIVRQLKNRSLMRSLEIFISGRLFDTSARNPVKEILLKLNLPDHRNNKDDMEVLKIKFSLSRQAKEQAQDLKSMITTSIHKLMIEVKDYKLKTKIENKKAWNCEVMLSKVRIPLNKLMDYVVALEDSAMLDAEQVDNLRKFCPTEEEMELLKDYEGDKGRLGKREKVFDLRESFNSVNYTVEEANKQPKVLDFFKDIRSLRPSSKIQMKILLKEMHTIYKGLEIAKQESSNAKRDSINFKKVGGQSA
ncbi:formin-like protein 18 [Tanacetum coccineum]